MIVNDGWFRLRMTVTTVATTTVLYCTTISSVQTLLSFDRERDLDEISPPPRLMLMLLRSLLLLFLLFIAASTTAMLRPRDRSAHIIRRGYSASLSVLCDDRRLYHY